ncbi:uncharacterized protein METZ01_LOCUS212064, partial [marine metagenome]
AWLFRSPPSPGPWRWTAATEPGIPWLGGWCRPRVPG